MKTNTQFNKNELIEIAQNQNMLIGMSAILFVATVAYALCFGIPNVLVINILNMVMAGQILLLAHSMKSPVKWLYCLCVMLPGLIGWVSLSTVIYRAGLLLKANGVQAGLLGVKESDLQALRA